MKKMFLSVIFIIVLALLVLAGCINFSTNVSGTEEPSDNLSSEPGSYEPLTYPGTYEPLTYEPSTVYVPATDEAGEEVTDEEGSQVYITVTEAPVTIPRDDPAYSEYASENNIPGELPTGSGNESPTDANGSEHTTNAQGQTPAVTGKNEFDIFRSGTFYIKGSMRDAEGENPLEMAITPNSIYMLTKFENVDMAILVSNGNTYLVYPGGKAYLEMSATVLKLMGLDTDELISSDDLGFSDLEPLSQATRTSQATLKGKNCTVYEFEKSDGTVSKVYMNGNSLMGLETVENGTVLSATYIDSITDAVPADKINPSSSYSKKSVFEFMGMLSDIMM